MQFYSSTFELCLLNLWMQNLQTQKVHSLHAHRHTEKSTPQTKNYWCHSICLRYCPMNYATHECGFREGGGEGKTASVWAFWRTSHRQSNALTGMICIISNWLTKSSCSTHPPTRDHQGWVPKQLENCLKSKTPLFWMLYSPFSCAFIHHMLYF